MKENILAVPSKDRLGEESLKLLSNTGVQFELPGRQLTTEANLPGVGSFTLALLRPKDIVKMVASGEIPLGITGQDTVEEYRLSLAGEVQTLLPLGIGRCRLVLAAPWYKMMTKEDLENAYNLGFYKYGFGPRRGIIEQFSGKTIATSYPGITRRYFVDKGFENLELSIKELSGSVEAAPALGMANAISDLVETGRSLGDNRLKEIETIFKSQAILITNTETKKEDNPFVDEMRNAIFKVLLARGNPDAIQRKARINELIALVR